MRKIVVVIVEIGTKQRLGGLYPRRRRAALRVRRLGTGAGLFRAGFRLFGPFFQLGHQSTYLGVGGAGAGPNTVNHLRYNVFHVPSRRMRSRVPLTKRTNASLSRLIPTP